MTQKTALIADDNAGWRRIITEILKDDFEIVGYAERGDEVCALASALRPQIITLDISMPGLSGLNALPRLRSTLPSTTIVMLTLMTEKVFQQEAYHRGADAWVSKWDAPSQLMLAIRSAIRPSDTRRLRRA